MTQDYNSSMSPLLQRFLLGVAVLSGMGTAVVVFYTFLVYNGVLPSPIQ